MIAPHIKAIYNMILKGKNPLETLHDEKLAPGDEFRNAYRKYEIFMRVFYTLPENWLERELKYIKEIKS